METLTTHGIKVSVKTHYREDYSKPTQNKFIFSYLITIENTNSFTVQLLSRFWRIFDSSGRIREVEGEGVVGDQPSIHPGRAYQYASWVALESEMGKMQGAYNFIQLPLKQEFQVRIPEFKLIVPGKLN